MQDCKTTHLYLVGHCTSVTCPSPRTVFCFLLLTGFYTLYMTYCIYDDDGGDCVQCPLSIMLQNSEHTDNADTRDDGRKIGLKNCKQWDLFEALPLTLCAKLSADHALPANLDHFRVFV